MTNGRSNLPPGVSNTWDDGLGPERRALEAEWERAADTRLSAQTASLFVSALWQRINLTPHEERTSKMQWDCGVDFEHAKCVAEALRIPWGQIEKSFGAGTRQHCDCELVFNFDTAFYSDACPVCAGGGYIVTSTNPDGSNEFDECPHCESTGRDVESHHVKG